MADSPERIGATIFFRDSGVVLLDAERWIDEDGLRFFQSTEFPFLIASAEDDQEAVDHLVEAAEQFFMEVRDLEEGATVDEMRAAKEIGQRLVEGYTRLEEARRRKALMSRLVGHVRRERRGNWRVRSRETGERSLQASRA